MKYYLIEYKKRFYTLESMFIEHFDLNYKQISKQVYVNLLLKELDFKILWKKIG